MDTTLAVIVLALAVLLAYYFVARPDGNGGNGDPCAPYSSLPMRDDVVCTPNADGTVLTYTSATQGAFPSNTVAGGKGTGVKGGKHLDSAASLADCQNYCENTLTDCAIFAYNPDDPLGHPCRAWVTGEDATGADTLASIGTTNKGWTTVGYPALYPAAS